MLTYEKARRSPKIFKAIAGMSPQQFDSLYAEVAKLYGEAEFARLNSKPRKRGVGAGRRFALDLRERLFMLLFYYRTYVTQILVGLVFSVGQATVSRDIANLEPVVRRCVPLPEKLHMAANKAKTVEDLEKIIPGLAVLIDASEQPVYRPQDDQTQKKYYSGKAKRHTMKTQYTTTYDGLIVHKSTSVEGSKHDFALFKQDNAAFPTDLPHGADATQGSGGRTRTIDIGDSAYSGMQKQYPDRDARTSIKRKPGRELTPEEKAYNRALSRIRILVEHAIRRIKIFRVMGDRYRNPRRKYNLINDIVCGLVNMLRLWERMAT